MSKSIKILEDWLSSQKKEEAFLINNIKYHEERLKKLKNELKEVRDEIKSVENHIGEYIG